MPYLRASTAGFRYEEALRQVYTLLLYTSPFSFFPRTGLTDLALWNLWRLIIFLFVNNCDRLIWFVTCTVQRSGSLGAPLKVLRCTSADTITPLTTPEHRLSTLYKPKDKQPTNRRSCPWFSSESCSRRSLLHRQTNSRTLMGGVGRLRKLCLIFRK